MACAMGVFAASPARTVRRSQPPATASAPRHGSSLLEINEVFEEETRNPFPSGCRRVK